MGQPAGQGRTMEENEDMTTTSVVYTVVIHQEDGSFWAEVEQLPGCFASGDTMEELQEAVTEAMGIYLSSPVSTANLTLAEVTQTERVEQQRFLVEA